MGLYTSTESDDRITASAPNASAQRITVPALPGSRIWAQITTSWVDSSTASASGTSSARHTATTPWGVTVSDSVARFCSLTA